MNGVKYDQEKPRWSLLPWDVLEWVCLKLNIKIKDTDKKECENERKADA